MSEQQLIGHVPVDSGRISIVDPSYARELGDNNAVYDPTEGVDQPNAHGVVTSVTTRTPYGDGVFPVYLETDDDGVPVAIRVQLVFETADAADEVDAMLDDWATDLKHPNPATRRRA